MSYSSIVPVVYTTEEVGHDVCLRYYHMTLVCDMSVEHLHARAPELGVLLRPRLMTGIIATPLQ